MREEIVNLRIGSILPHIFKRPLLHVNAADSMLVITTLLALGPRIYVDGLVVLNFDKAVGTIGGKQAIEYILYHRVNWVQGTAGQIMVSPVSIVNAKEPLNEALEVFERSGFAFMPVAVDGTVVTSLSVRDMLGLVVQSGLKTPASRFASETVAVTKDTSMGSALELMLEQGIRTLIVRGKSQTVLNDRMFLEFLLSHAGKQALSKKGTAGLFEATVDTFEKIRPRKVSSDTPLDMAAKRLLDVKAPCLLLDNGSIVTPWDIVMKGLGRE